mmetsp:Transcript_86444/g.245096  ORF Transcript_86444/g.245096 Transcript_86444/m.245096 type:complete len:200 (+) Transcript_86444:335-934(+)
MTMGTSRAWGRPSGTGSPAAGHARASSSPRRCRAAGPRTSVPRAPRGAGTTPAPASPTTSGCSAWGTWTCCCSTSRRAPGRGAPRRAPLARPASRTRRAAPARGRATWSGRSGTRCPRRTTRSCCARWACPTTAAPASSASRAPTRRCCRWSTRSTTRSAWGPTRRAARPWRRAKAWPCNPGAPSASAGRGRGRSCAAA